MLLSAGMVAVILVAALSLAFGSRAVSFPEVVEGLSLWFRGETPTELGAIAVQQRIPRTVLALLAGAALAAVFVYAVGSIGPGGATPIKLALAGAATTAALSSLVSAILLPRANVMNEFWFRQVGGVGAAEWSSITTMTPLLVGAAIIALASGPSLNALAMGDDTASGLGVRVGRTRVIAAVAGVTLCAAVTSVAGPIGFVGLMVPHVVRLAVGPDQRWLLPLSAIGGAILLTVADTLGRVIGHPGEVEAGILTAFVGAPVLVIIARRTRMRAL